MPHALQRRPHTHPSHDVLLTAASVVLAVLAVVVTLIEQYDAGAVVAFATVVVGGVSMMLSATITERFETVTATVTDRRSRLALSAHWTGGGPTRDTRSDQ